MHADNMLLKSSFNVNFFHSTRVINDFKIFLTSIKKLIFNIDNFDCPSKVGVNVNDTFFPSCTYTCAKFCIVCCCNCM